MAQLFSEGGQEQDGRGCLSGLSECARLDGAVDDFPGFEVPGAAQHNAPWSVGGGWRYFVEMKIWRIIVLAGVVVAGCVTVPPGSDGIALECDVCRTMWIRIDCPGDLVGDYRIEHEPGRQVCAACDRIGRRFLRTGQAPARCEVCGGTLTTGVVELTPDAPTR